MNLILNHFLDFLRLTSFTEFHLLHMNGSPEKENSLCKLLPRYSSYTLNESENCTTVKKTLLKDFIL